MGHLEELGVTFTTHRFSSVLTGPYCLVFFRDREGLEGSFVVSPKEYFVWLGDTMTPRGTIPNMNEHKHGCDSD